MTPEERYTVIETLLDQERIRMAQGIIRNVRTRAPEETAAVQKAQQALDELHTMLDARP